MRSASFSFPIGHFYRASSVMSGAPCSCAFVVLLFFAVRAVLPSLLDVLYKLPPRSSLAHSPPMYTKTDNFLLFYINKREMTGILR